MLTLGHNLCFPVFNRIIEESVANEIDESVFIHAWSIVSEHLRMRLDEAYDIIVLLCGWLETALAIGGDDELVTMNASAVTTQTYIRRVAQAIPSVEGIACIYQYVLNTQALFEIVVGKFCHIRVSNFHSPTGFLQFSESAHYQNLRTGLLHHF